MLVPCSAVGCSVVLVLVAKVCWICAPVVENSITTTVFFSRNGG
jgi:hypothetical protein